MTTSFARRLLAWFERERRDLPWRRTRDPWAIWVSEVMLQQTRVEAVRDAFRRFLAVFPTPAAFASASDDALLAAWRGLGYYRRARLLRDGARQVVAEHAGRVPDNAATLGDLAGIGPYTRGAIASIAFGEPVIAVDGNVERVLARHDAITGDVKRGATRRQIEGLVADRMDPARPGDFNQALMELGALICTPRSPRCPDCPVRADCRGRAAGLVDRLPVLPARRAVVEVNSRAVICETLGNVLATRIPAGEINSGQLTLPGAGVLHDCPSTDALQHALWELFGAEFTIEATVAAEIRHTITHHRIRLRVHAASLRGRRPAALTLAAPELATWSTSSRKVFAKLGLRANSG